MPSCQVGVRAGPELRGPGARGQHGRARGHRAARPVLGLGRGTWWFPGDGPARGPRLELAGISGALVRHRVTPGRPRGSSSAPGARAGDPGLVHADSRFRGRERTGLAEPRAENGRGTRTPQELAESARRTDNAGGGPRLRPGLGLGSGPGGSGRGRLGASPPFRPDSRFPRREW